MGFFDSILNIGYQQQVNQQQLALQKESWQREDTSVQRRVADLKAAGLNPVLAAGQGASSSSPISINAPHAQIGDEAATVISALRAKKDMAVSDSQKKLIDHQIEESKERTNNTRIANETARWNLNESIKHQERTTDQRTELDRYVMLLEQLFNRQSALRNVGSQVLNLLTPPKGQEPNPNQKPERYWFGLGKPKIEGKPAASGRSLHGRGK